MLNFVKTKHKKHDEKSYYSNPGNPDCRLRFRGPGPDRQRSLVFFGKYWLVIDSPTLYAEGAFLIN